MTNPDASLSTMSLPSPADSDGDMIPLQPANDEIQDDSDPTSDSSALPSQKPSLPRSRAKKARKSAHQSQQSKPPLRPAKDILARIRHDPALDESEWLVGYHDRLEGVMEMDVSAWKGDFSDEEWIPQHRILYFRKKADDLERRMWDRESRLDRLFGSGVVADQQELAGLNENIEAQGVAIVRESSNAKNEGSDGVSSGYDHSAIPETTPSPAKPIRGGI